MRREFHVRFCEGAGGKLPRATRLVVICEREDDAFKVMNVLPKRFGRYGLTLHPEKTRLVRFVRPARRPGQGRQEENPPPPQTFDFLGFTHRWGVSRENRWYVERRTSKGRLTRALGALRTWCRQHRHDAVRDQHRSLILKMHGHYGYYGITGNARGIGRFFHHVQCAWRFWLNRRSQRARMTWDTFNRLLVRYPLPLPRLPLRGPRLSANP